MLKVYVFGRSLVVSTESDPVLPPLKQPVFMNLYLHVGPKAELSLLQGSKADSSAVSASPL